MSREALARHLVKVVVELVNSAAKKITFPKNVFSNRDIELTNKLNSLYIPPIVGALKASQKNEL